MSESLYDSMRTVKRVDGWYVWLGLAWVGPYCTRDRAMTSMEFSCVKHCGLSAKTQ